MTETAATIVEADLDLPEHQEAVVALTAEYAQEADALGRPLPPDVLDGLVPGLRDHPTTLILLAYVDGEPVGVATCFAGFSTFHAKPLLNLHDLAVTGPFRGRGIGRALLAAVERKARELGCCKVTLEVNERNGVARRLYESNGFAHVGSDSAAGPALFYAKTLVARPPD